MSLAIHSMTNCISFVIPVCTHMIHLIIVNEAIVPFEENNGEMQF